MTLQASVAFDMEASSSKRSTMATRNSCRSSRWPSATATCITMEQVLFLCYGPDANGKGTFTHTLQFVLGDYAFNMPFTTIELRDRTRFRTTQPPS